MLDTATDTYNAFLDGIKKSYTGTVIPAVFTRLINDWGMNDWLKQNVSEEAGVDVTQKQIDDLQMLKIITDGEMVYNGDTMYEITPDTVSGYYFSKPDGVTAINNTTATSVVYPKYLRLINVRFKVNYVNNECGLTGVSDYLKTQIMRSGNKSETEDNYYLKPMDNSLYYEQVNNKFKLITGTTSTGRSMKIEYLRTPRPFYFDANRNIKACYAITSNATGIGTIRLNITTALGVYTSPIVNIVATDSKYTIAQNIYNAIIADLTLPASIRNYTTVNLNSVCIGQYGYDVLVATATTTGVAIPYTITRGLTVSDVNIELPEQQRKEIVDLSVRIYLERVTDLRYKSFFTEQVVRQQANK